MAWRRSGEKPLSEPMMVSLLTHICVTRSQWVNSGFSINWKENGLILENISIIGCILNCHFVDLQSVMNISAKWWQIHLRISMSRLQWSQCLKLMVAQSPLATENWAGPVKFDPGQVKIIKDYIRYKEGVFLNISGRLRENFSLKHCGPYIALPSVPRLKQANWTEVQYMITKVLLVLSLISQWAVSWMFLLYHNWYAELSPQAIRILLSGSQGESIRTLKMLWNFCKIVSPISVMSPN